MSSTATPTRPTRRTVSVNLPADCLDWDVARRIIAEQYNVKEWGQMSRTARYPDCDDRCADDCGHPYTMRYTATILVGEPVSANPVPDDCEPLDDQGCTWDVGFLVDCGDNGYDERDGFLLCEKHVHAHDALSRAAAELP